MLMAAVLMVIIIFRIYYALIRCALDYAKERKELKLRKELANNMWSNRVNNNVTYRHSRN